MFGGRYMDLRRKTEAKLRQLFEGRGGRPDRETPHYFTLGPCPWFAGVYPDPRSITLNWRNLPESVVSVTYPDSFIAMGFGPEFGLPEEPDRAYHGQVFLLSEIDGLVSQFGLPDGRADDAYAGYETRSFEKYIEVQLWSDTPVRQFLRG